MKASIFICLLFSHFFLIPRSSGQSCRNETFSSNILYATCDSLPYLGATLHWTYHPSEGIVDVAYRARQLSSGWVGWAINPSGVGMIGSNAFFAFHNSSSGALNVWTYQLKSYNPTVQDENLTFAVYSRAAEYSGGAFTIYATLALPGNLTAQNTVWQTSTEFQNGVPHGHPLGDGHVLSSTQLDFLSGATVSEGDPLLHRKNIHGVLNAISWGTLMPIGVIMARYVKVMKPAGAAWLHLHVAFQSVGYILGVSGWGLGLKLGSDSGSPDHTEKTHKAIGITLFCLATLQALALLARPKIGGKYRIYWNLYHWTLGYSVIILTVVNIFKGFDILNPAKKWKHAYIGVLSTLAAAALLLEVYTWSLVFRKQKKVAENVLILGEVANGGATTDVAEREEKQFDHDQVVVI